MNALTINLNQVVNSIVFSLLGIFIFVVGFALVDRITPYQLWKEICEKNNMALATFAGLCALGIAVIVAAAIQ